MDHDKLREAIKWIRSRWCPTAASEAGLAQAIEHAPSICIPWVKLQDILAAAESTLSKTRMVEVWHVEFCRNWNLEIRVFQHQHTAQTFADTLPDEPKGPTFSCIRVTGPHMQEMPA